MIFPHYFYAINLRSMTFKRTHPTLGSSRSQQTHTFLLLSNFMFCFSLLLQNGITSRKSASNCVIYLNINNKNGILKYLNYETVLKINRGKEKNEKYSALVKWVKIRPIGENRTATRDQPGTEWK